MGMEGVDGAPKQCQELMVLVCGNPLEVVGWTFLNSFGLMWVMVLKFWEYEWCKDCSLKVAFPELYSISRNKESLVLEVSSLMGSCIGTFGFVVFCQIGRKHQSICFEMCFIPQMCGVLVLTDFARSQH